MADVNPLTIPLIELHITIQDDPREFTLKTFEAFPQKSSMQLYILHLPSANLVAPLWMTTLKISEDSLSNFHCSPKDILIFLSACPLLQVFSFRGWHHNEPPSPDDYHLPVVKLLHLHTLQLKNTCMTRAILSHLDTPRLVNLNLEHLNTEFALEGEYQEEGDSDDEANDFSQSPSTDRATGMGLRNLIKRCNPPIRTLNMDYSDLRTKDFEFVFDKLRWLEEFRIVASDMSDSVISLFRPYTLSGEQTPRIRLPQLRLLSLYNCNRLSGDAVVDALSERETYTNHPSTWAQPLNNVRIFTCDRIHSEHAEKLTQLLGTRLQVQLV
ncbi:hypothetical protein H0H93_004971 [Arthromyces matolae]|nr:hypothetical protein H0H93_004971 [Arthromyces matolae]